MISPHGLSVKRFGKEVTMKITMAHGSGGRETGQLIREISKQIFITRCWIKWKIPPWWREAEGLP